MKIRKNGANIRGQGGEVPAGRRIDFLGNSITLHGPKARDGDVAFTSSCGVPAAEGRKEKRGKRI
jgi:hypothetical protein